MSNNTSHSTSQNHSPSIKRHTVFRGHQETINRIAWSSDGRILASPSDDGTIRLWDVTNRRSLTFFEYPTARGLAWSPDDQVIASCSIEKAVRLWDLDVGKIVRTMPKSSGAYSLAWSPDGTTLAAALNNNTVQLWNTITDKIQTFTSVFSNNSNALAWSPDSKRLAAAAADGTVQVWDANSGQCIFSKSAHINSASAVTWSPDGRLIASCGGIDQVIRIWDVVAGREIKTLEGHTDIVLGVDFSPCGRILASISADQKVILWNCQRWQAIVAIRVNVGWPPFSWINLAFHPHLPLLAVPDGSRYVITVWDIDVEALINTVAGISSVYYTNAKVVMVGETGTGKTCLARALMGEPFEPQESTHGMKVWDFHAETVTRPDGGHISRETLLWDLAGQTDYQVVHQLFLEETALGIILFDSSHPDNPFGGVGHWEKALRRVAGETCPKILVAGRVDRGYPAVMEQDIRAFCNEHGFRKFIATSAKTDEGISTLKEAIAEAIPWDKLPVTSSPGLWKEIREYLLKRRSGDEVLTRRADMREAFRLSRPDAEFSDAEFNTVITHAQAQGLLWRFSFGDFVLLKPELLNDYASAIVRAARKHPKGLGSVVEREVLDAQINFEDLQRLPDYETERSLLHAVLELFLAREVALREGQHLVFPSKFNRKHPEFPKPPRREVAYSFAGPVEDIYATLTVRLFYCGAFELKDLWKNAAEFRDAVGRVCGILLDTTDEGRGILSIFFEEAVSMDSKVLFLRFIHEHLQSRALTNSVIRQRIYRCPGCEEEVENKRAIDLRLKRGQLTIPCQYCDEQIDLVDMLEEKFGDPNLLQQVRLLEEEVEEKKELEINITTAKAKKDIGEFDVFLAHNNQDKKTVEAIAEELRRRGLNPWFDKWNLPPGVRFAEEIERVLPTTKSVAVFVGKRGPGPWQKAEIYAALELFASNNLPLIPVLLPSVKKEPKLPLLLRQFGWVRFAKGTNDSEALDALQWGITGKRS